jgi:hypothetical protein
MRWESTKSRLGIGAAVLPVIALSAWGWVLLHERSVSAAPPDREARDLMSERDMEQLERQLEQMGPNLEIQLEGLDRLEHLGGLKHLEGLGERIAERVSRALEGLDLDDHTSVHMSGFDDERLERQMQQLAEHLERNMAHVERHVERVGRRLSEDLSDLDERDRDLRSRTESSLRREMRRLERQMERLREELQRREDPETRGGAGGSGG